MVFISHLGCDLASHVSVKDARGIETDGVGWSKR